jgi:parvulin-like peptidyl-prolyl isomerase
MSAAACGSGPIGEDSAATVDGAEISAQRVRDMAQGQLAYFDAALDAGAVPEAEMGAFDEQRGLYAGSGEDTLGTAGAAQALSSLIEFQVLEGLLDDRGGEVTNADIEQGRTQLLESLEAQEITVTEDFDALIDAEVRRQAVVQGLSELITAPPDERTAQLEEAFELAVDDFTQRCVQVIVVDDEAAAQDAVDRIEFGEDVAEVAADVSTDPSGEEQGGDIGCQATADLAAVFGEAVYGTEAGDLIDPVGAEFGWVLGQVNDVQVPTFEEVRPQLEQTVPDAGQEQLQAAVEEALAGAEVSVAERYGTWDSDQRTVVPPVDPAAPSTTEASSDELVESPDGVDPSGAPAPPAGS